MARRLIWSQRARLDLMDTVDFIAQDAPANAAAVGRRIVARVRSLADQPGQGRRVPEHEGDTELRVVFVHRRRIIYRVQPDTVVIVAIVHGARMLRNAPPL